MQIRRIFAGCVMAFAAVGANAQGFVDFSELRGLDAEPVVEVDVSPLMIGIARSALARTDPQTAELLTKLRRMQLSVYDSSKNTREINNIIDEVTEGLEGGGWERVFTVQDEASLVRVLVRSGAEGISGMTVMVNDDTEAFFINIDATVTTEDLGRLLSVFPFDEMLGALMSGPNAPFAVGNAGSQE